MREVLRSRKTIFIISEKILRFTNLFFNEDRSERKFAIFFLDDWQFSFIFLYEIVFYLEILLEFVILLIYRNLYEFF